MSVHDYSQPIRCVDISWRNWIDHMKINHIIIWLLLFDSNEAPWLEILFFKSLISQNKTSTMIFHNYTHWCCMRFKVAAIAINLNTSNWSVYIHELSIAITPARHWTLCFICVFIKIKIKVKTTGLQLAHDQICLHISSSVANDKSDLSRICTWGIYWVHSIVHYIIIFIY